MSDDRNFEIVSYAGFRDERANEQAAEQKANSLLRSWRSRLDSERWHQDVPLARTYVLEDGGQTQIDSATASAARVTYTSARGDVTVYEFKFADGRGALRVHGVPDDTLPMDLYEDFSRYLFDCDRLEMGDI